MNVPLIRLKDIGKIYVSEGSVAVGIRGVNLDLDIGEFVAVTGKSGSGKTTLLNILSGIDTYEEGQLYINGEETAHYSQSDWEVYRQKYISFIFQEYNIIDSFTVLQNVELALSHIESRKERRQKALELIGRVGLEKFKHHKGSKLSGGQKQRTVIARALAKDSPVILADEPTGNLDSQTSKEIIELLHEISKEKLVVIVTHSFDEVKDYATREIRIFDGGVERDEILKNTDKKPLSEKAAADGKKRILKKGIELGWNRFCATPRLSVFTCILMIIAMLGSFMATALCVTDLDAFDKRYMFTSIEGRGVVVSQNGDIIDEEKLKELADKVGALSYMSFDYLLDQKAYASVYIPGSSRLTAALRFTFDEEAELDAGRMPNEPNEAVLVLPISWQQVYGKGTLKKDYISLFGGSVYLNVVGVSYYYDNTKDGGRVIMTREGFENISNVVFLQGDYSFSANAAIDIDNGLGVETLSFNVKVDSRLDDGEAYLTGSYRDQILKADGDSYSVKFRITERDMYTGEAKMTYIEPDSITFTDDTPIALTSDDMGNVIYYEDGVMNQTVIYQSGGNESCMYISDSIAEYLVNKTGKEKYTQGSLFFENDKQVEEAKDILQNMGYVCVPSSATYTSENIMIDAYIEAILSIVLWFMMIAFLSLFLSLCSSRVITSRRGDLAILRSMGIENKTVKVSMYSQMLISAIPSVILLAVMSFIIYLTPKTNGIFPFMHAPQYILIVLGVIIITVLLTGRYNKRMFSESVRKTLKGGQRES